MPYPDERRRGRAIRPVAEDLEGRCLLNASGPAFVAKDAALTAWLPSAPQNQQQHPAPHDSPLTYSFVPDGTLIYGVPSDLNAAMAARGLSTGCWQTAVEQAAAIWSAATGVTLQLVPDNGTSLNTSDPLAGDVGFGDIRVAGIAMQASLLGGTFDPLSTNWGTAAGDIVLNTNQPWGIVQSQANLTSHSLTSIDLLTVALHEFGHALGGGEVADPSAVLYEGYLGPKHTLTPVDIAQIPPNHTTQGLVSGTSLSWEATLPQATSSLNVAVVVQTPGFYILCPFVSGGEIQIERTGPDGTFTLPSDRTTGMFLIPGIYRFRVANTGAGPVSFNLIFHTPKFSPEAILPNGISQASALSLVFINSENRAPGLSTSVGPSLPNGTPAFSPGYVAGSLSTFGPSAGLSNGVPIPAHSGNSTTLLVTAASVPLGCSTGDSWHVAPVGLSSRDGTAAVADSVLEAMPGINYSLETSAVLLAQGTSASGRGPTTSKPIRASSAGDSDSESASGAADEAALAAGEWIEDLHSMIAAGLASLNLSGPPREFDAAAPSDSAHSGRVEQASTSSAPLGLGLLASLVIAGREMLARRSARHVPGRVPRTAPPRA